MDFNAALVSLGGTGAVVSGIITFLVKHEKGKGFILKLLAKDGLDERIQGAISVAVSALEAALNARGQELERVEQELLELRNEVSDLRSADDRKTQRIAELEAEVVRLSAENETLKKELERRRGGRPKKETV